MHRLLERQLKRSFGGLEQVPDDLRPFLAVIDATYTEADSDRALAERSLELASQELLQRLAQRKEAEEKLHQAYETLKKVDHDRTQFLNNAAHELSTPLTPIKLQIHMLRAKGEDAVPSGRIVAILDRNFDRLAHLVKDLLDAARIQSRQLAVHMAPLDLASIARQTAETYVPMAGEAGIRLQCDAPAPMTVLGDPGRLAQVMDNLVSNALKFTPHGGTVHLEGRSQDGQALVLVHDTGRGLSAEDIGQLFKPFSQVHDPMQQTVAGTGLGLYISRTIVEAHGGTLEVSSPGRGQGATFRVVLPLHVGMGIQRAISKAV